MNRQQKRSQKAIQRRMEREAAKKGRNPSPLEALNARLNNLENQLGESFSTTFQNSRQLKHGLDAAEVNQRAMVKVLHDLLRGVLPVWEKAEMIPTVELLDGKIDWGKYYRASEDDIAAERLELYKQHVKVLNSQADTIEASLEEFEKDLQEELDKDVAHAVPKKQAVDRFLADLKKEIAKVRTAAKIIEDGTMDKEKVEDFNVKILSDTLFMISRNKAKKEKEKEKEAAAKQAESAGVVETAPAGEPETVEFGG